MSNLKRYGNDVWDRLFDLLYDCDDQGTGAEVKARLQAAGIDMRPAYRRMHHMVAEKKAREQLAKAPALRQSMMAKLAGIVPPEVADLRTGIKNLIARAFTGQAQVAHYQKLEKAASEEDLRSLFEDLNKLAALRQDQDEPKAE